MYGLIGYTGFVGQHLHRQASYDRLFNSSNIGEIAGLDFDTLVCAAAPGSMLEANRLPDRDRSRIEALAEQLRQTRANRFVLISSIAVFASFDGGDDETSNSYQTELAYGRHRRLLEAVCADHFDRCLIVRLPALFGTGLKKNFIFDLLNPIPTLLTTEKLAMLRSALPTGLGQELDALFTHDPETGFMRVDRASLATHPDRTAMEDATAAAGLSATMFHSPETTYQLYNMSRLWEDIERAARAGCDVIHLATEPQTAADIHERLIGQPMPETGARVHREDMHTRHADLWGRTGPYIADAATIRQELADFFEAERRARA